MKKIFKLLTGAVLIALIAPAFAESPSNAVKTNLETVKLLNNTSLIINPMDPGYVWGNPLAIGLSGANPIVFESAAFRMDPGGLSSGNLYTASMNDFRNADPDAGASNATKKAAKIGLVNWPS